MNFLGRNCEMEFGWKPTSRIIVKWTVKWNCEMESENLLGPCFCLISHYFTFFILWNSMKKYEIAWNNVKWAQRMQFILLMGCLDLASVSFSCSILHRHVASFVAEACSALIRSASDTVRDLGTPLPKFHIHMFTSYSLLSSPEPWFLSARPCLTLDDLAKREESLDGHFLPWSTEPAALCIIRGWEILQAWLAQALEEDRVHTAELYPRVRAFHHQDQV